MVLNGCRLRDWLHEFDLPGKAAPENAQGSDKRQGKVDHECQHLVLKDQSTSSARLTRGNSYGGASLESVSQNAGSGIVATSE